MGMVSIYFFWAAAIRSPRVLVQAFFPPVSITSPWQGMRRSHDQPATIAAATPKALKEKRNGDVSSRVVGQRKKQRRGEGTNCLSDEAIPAIIFLCMEVPGAI